MFGTSPPNWTPTVHASEVRAPFILYTPIIVQPPNVTPINAPFVVYTTVIVTTTGNAPINAPFTLSR